MWREDNSRSVANGENTEEGKKARSVKGNQGGASRAFRL